MNLKGKGSENDRVRLLEKRVNRLKAMIVTERDIFLKEDEKARLGSEYNDSNTMQEGYQV